ncbi:MAG: DUF362 domain-containing protein [Gemmatimonadota bacterium]|nr:MAG: DUF362 domain-containing protein [Gemmatimonadota bacterium]
MAETENRITRRDFIRGTTCATLALAMGIGLEAQEKEKPLKLTKVMLVRDEKVFDKEGRIDPMVIQKMMDDAVTVLFDKKKPVEAWKTIIKPKDIVGIKSNAWGSLPTPDALEQTLKRGILDAGVDEKNISIDDRGVLGNKVFQKATALINARPLRTHAWSGVGSLLKNYIMFVPSPSDYHGNTCADLAAIWKLPIVKDKTRLNVLVMLEPLFHGVGRHHFDKKYTWKYHGLLVGTDPVAVDAVGLHIFKAKRLEYFGEDRPMTPPPHHIAFADTKHHLGTSDLEKIELVKLGWKEGILI